MTVRRIEYVTDFVDGRWEVQSVIYEAVRQFDSWDDADALKESLRRAEKQRQVIAEVRYVCEDCSFSTDVVYDAAAHSYAHDNGHRTVVKVPHIDGEADGI